jgi:hypothetical protein
MGKGIQTREIQLNEIIGVHCEVSKGVEDICSSPALWAGHP